MSTAVRRIAADISGCCDAGFGWKGVAQDYARDGAAHCRAVGGAARGCGWALSPGGTGQPPGGGKSADRVYRARSSASARRQISRVMPLTMRRTPAAAERLFVLLRRALEHRAGSEERSLVNILTVDQRQHTIS